jgi:acyl-CoA synthetase (AMP-forming)/AMP-acid ligase II/acyl dehydratase
MTSAHTSRWLTVTQEMVNQHAITTGDGYAEWVHCDPERAAREMPYGGAIVQGFLQVALLIQLCRDANAEHDFDINHSLNYGFDRLRFLKPLIVGRAVRARVLARHTSPHPRGGDRLVQQVELEDEVGNVVLAAEWLAYRLPSGRVPERSPEPAEQRSLEHLMQHWTAEQPSREAWVFGTRRISYREAESYVQQLADALRVAGIRPGDRVAVMADPRPEAWALLLACARVGAIYAGLNPRYTPTEREQLIEHADPALIVGIGYLEDRRGRPGVITCTGSEFVGEQLVAAVGAAAVRDSQTPHPDHRLVEADGALLLVFTSGSTGTPKGALLSEASLLYIGRIVARHFSTREPVRTLCNLPMNHVGALLDICNSTLAAGGTLIFQPAFEPKEVLRAVAEEGLTLLGGVPAMFELLAREPSWSTTDFSRLEKVIIGGNAPSAALTARLQRETGATVMVAYGSTEGLSLCSFSRKDDPPETLAEHVGRFDPDLPTRVADHLGLPVTPGSVGEIQLGPAARFLGYWRDPAATQAAFTPDGWLHSGDLAALDEHGNVRLHGRLRHMYKSGGYNVSPFEVEQALEGLDQVVHAVVVAARDPLWSQVGVAFIVPAHDRVEVSELERVLRERLADYKVPKHWVLTTELPLLPIGKPDRKRLEVEASERFGS